MVDGPNGYNPNFHKEESMTKPKILVTSAAGRTGAAAVLQFIFSACNTFDKFQGKRKPVGNQ